MQPNLPQIGLGTGGEEYLRGQRCVEVVSDALEMGYRHIDTAVMYGNHESIGQAIELSDVPRDEVIVSTKVPPEKSEYAAVIDCIETALDELKLEHIDIAYLHFPSPEYDPEHTLAAFERLVQEGSIGSIGVSNLTGEQLSEAKERLGRSLGAFQIELHPFNYEPKLVELVQEYEMNLVAFSPLARGTVFESEVISEIASTYDTTPARVTLSWLISKPDVVAVPKSTNRTHLAENLKAPSLELTDAEIRRIDGIQRTERFVDPARYLR